MNNQGQCYGFSLIRNGLKYDYPFRESLQSLSKLTKKVFLAVGDSEDCTEDEVNKIPSLHMIPTRWDESMREGGKILSQQTNLALNGLRMAHPQGWGIYLQADEVFHEDDFDLIHSDLKKAEEQGCDAVRFRYLHFWLRSDSLAIGKRWYPQEIRAIRLDSSIESYGDAQSFRSVKKVFESDARVFHYGHVREASAYELKKEDFHKWWHPDHAIQKIVEGSRTQDSQELVLKYWGSHPQVMHHRLGFQGYPQVEQVYLVGRPENYSKKFVSSISSKKIIWGNCLRDFPKNSHFPQVILEPQSFLDRWQARKTQVPLKMKSPQARVWTLEFRATLLLSEKGVGVE